MGRQLTFDLPVRTAQGRDDFFVTPANQAAVHLLDRGWPGGRVCLIGPSGSGKTHLAQIWATEHAAEAIAAKPLAGQLEALLARAPQAVLVEDVQAIAGDAASEEALFHLLNAQMGRGGDILLTCTGHPAHLGLGLPDLVSRLSGAASAVLAPPDDGLVTALYVKQFEDRQIEVPADVISYLVARGERSFEAVSRIVDALDAQSLTERRAITRRMAGRVLDNIDGLGE